MKVHNISKGTQDSVIQLDISGTVFKTRYSTLQSIPDSRLAKLDKTSDIYNEASNSYYYDRDPDSFRHILNSYRHGELHMSKDICPQQFRKEIAFWKIPVKLLSPCCWKSFYEGKGDLEVISTLIIRLQETAMATNKVGDKEKNLLLKDMNDKMTKNLGKGTAPQPQRPNKLWLFLEEPTSSQAAKIWCFFYLAVVFVSVLVVFMWMIPAFRVAPYINYDSQTHYFNLNESAKNFLIQYYDFSENLILLGMSDPHPVLFAVDIFCMTVFIMETLVHFLACPTKKRYLREICNIVKVVLCIAMVVTCSLEMNKSVIDDMNKGRMFLAIRSISITRLILVFKLRKLYKGLDIMLLSLESSLKELALLAFVVLVCVIVYGTMMFSAEIENDDFPNVWVSMWWAMITMTTVGYGDFYPTSSFGYVIGTACAINGLIALTLPVAAIASNFARFYSKHAELEQHQKIVAEQEKVTSDTFLHDNNNKLSILSVETYEK